MHRPTLVPLALLALWLGAAQGNAAASGDPPKRPNIVLILADDIGVETLGVYGGEHATPNLDALANKGVRFDQAHATPLCTPSRVRLLTGRNSFRNYRAFGSLDPNEDTLAKALKRAQYRTAVAGKWQLAGSQLDGVPGSSPRDAGFDEWFTWHTRPAEEGCRYWSPSFEMNGAAEDYPGAYGPDLVSRFALDFVDRNASGPFFLYYSMLLAHDPFVATPRASANSMPGNFAHMMEYMDFLIGRLIDRLDALGLTDRTLLVFVGDNGTHKSIETRRGELRVLGGKATTLDTGTHVPLLLHWPERIPGSAAFPGMVDLTDLFATIVSAGGVSSHSHDGHDLLASLSGHAKWPRRAVFMEFANDYWHLDPAVYAFDAMWKLYADGRLFNIAEDPLERQPLAEGQLAGAAGNARSFLYLVMETSGFRPLSLDDAYFPRDFDTETFPYEQLERQREDKRQLCSDPARRAMVFD